MGVTRFCFDREKLLHGTSSAGSTAPPCGQEVCGDIGQPARALPRGSSRLVALPPNLARPCLHRHRRVAHDDTRPLGPAPIAELNWQDATSREIPLVVPPSQPLNIRTCPKSPPTKPYAARAFLRCGRLPLRQSTAQRVRHPAKLRRAAQACSSSSNSTSSSPSSAVHLYPAQNGPRGIPCCAGAQGGGRTHKPCGGRF